MKFHKYLYIIPSLTPGGAEYQTVNHINYIYSNVTEHIYLVVIHKDVDLLPLVKIPSDNVYLLQTKTIKFNHKYIVHQEMMRAAVSLRKIVRYTDTDVMIAVLNSAHYIARLALLANLGRSNVKLITYYRNVYFQLSPLSSLPRKMFNWAMSLMARVDDGTIFISEAVKKDITTHRYVAPKHTVIYNSLPERSVDQIPASSILSEVPKDCFTILFPGRLHMQKGHMAFLEVFRRLIDNCQSRALNIQLLIAGDGPLGSEIAAFIQKFHLEDFVHLLGTVENDYLQALMSEVDLVVVPSTFEGFGNVAIEALRAGATLLTSTSGGLDEIISDGYNGYKFQTGDMEACFDKLSSIVQDYSSMKINPEVARSDFQARFTLKSQIQQILEFTESL